MCGIFGIVLKENATVTSTFVQTLLSKLYVLSESRGKESAGLHIYQPQTGKSWRVKAAQPASRLLKTPEYKQAIQQGLAVDQPLVVIAHSRLATNGTAELDRNNQPVRWGPVTMIHNGIIVNVDDLWARHHHLQRHAEVDTEVLAAMAADGMRRVADPVAVTQQIFASIKGAASIAWVHDQAPGLTLATNTGDLYIAEVPDIGTIFASECHILRHALERPEIDITWLKAGQGCYIDATITQHFCIDEEAKHPIALRNRPVEHADFSTGSARLLEIINQDADESLLRYNEKRMRELKRCTRCVLPETFPFIAFDSGGVCNYCYRYRPRYARMHPAHTRQEFIKTIEHYRRHNGTPDVLVPFSGGRDSSFGLHLIQKEFGFKPVTFTYDWGMVTDLARRNIARMCGQLGVQNILVSANIKTKRENIRKNVSAWLKKPDLGMVPLFMAGDKHFFQIVNQLKKQTGIDLNLWCANPLENTDFKSGFCGVPPDFGKSRVDYLSFTRKMRLSAYYLKNFATNPAYLNSSLADTFSAFLSYYFEPRRDFYFIFDHFIWNEDEVNNVLLNEYDWERSPDSTSTWRIGDGTAPFYNYIYMTACGFSEFDTFRSNQIREGVMTREAALESVLVENRPRTQSLRWYLDVVGLDFNATIQRINQLDVMKLHQ